MRLWSVVPPMSAPLLGGLCRHWEASGLEGVAATQLHAAPWAPLAVAAAATSTLEVATGVALAFTRSPLETALGALELDQISDGRLTLGLAAGTRDWNHRFYGATATEPVERLDELIRLVRVVWSAAADGRPPRFDGRYFEVDARGWSPVVQPVRASIPIHLGAFSTAMFELAGREADGIIGHPMWTTSWIDDVVRPAAARGRDRSDVERPPTDITEWLIVSAGDDVPEAVADARLTVAHFASMPGYLGYFRSTGHGEAAAALCDAAASRRELPLAVVTEEMVRTYAAVGTVDEVVDQARRRAVRADRLCVVPPVGLPPDRLLQRGATTVEVLGRLLAL